MSNAHCISNLRFWLFTIALLMVWLLVLSTASASTTSSRSNATTFMAINKELELKNRRNCKSLCSPCGCLGFYCGEECICECNNENSNTQCIATMQNNARKMRIPFELLIQGPTANRFVRTALQFGESADRKSVSKLTPGRNKRSTVIIYRPSADSNTNTFIIAQRTKKSLPKLQSKSVRNKRSVPQLDWFTDLANTLVRPAPLKSAYQKSQMSKVSAETAMEPQRKRSSSKSNSRAANDKINRDWFSESSSSLLKPAPLLRRQSNKNNNDNNSNNNNNADSGETSSHYKTAMEKLPRMIQETIRNIQETAIREDIGEALAARLKEGTEMLHDTLDAGNGFELFPKPARADVLAEAFGNARQSLLRSAVSASNSQPAPPAKYLIPWFRPGRFLQRVQQAISNSD